MKVLILGVDGYLGWSLVQYLSERGDEVWGCDNFSRRKKVQEMKSLSVIPIPSMEERLLRFKDYYRKPLEFREGDITDYVFVEALLEEAKCDAIVHLAEMPSAAYSMIGVEHCVETHTNNVIGTLNVLYAMQKIDPSIHLLKLGTMGEYGTPDVDIPEGFFEVNYKGRNTVLPFPRKPGSWYHQTKVHDSSNILMACDMWGLRSTDIMQGVVYGVRPYEVEREGMQTRFDVDECFGTAVNRFCAQATIGFPVTVYGSGEQVRGFLPLQDSMQCLRIALQKPPKKGEYRVLNQFEEVYSLWSLAVKVAHVRESMGHAVDVCCIENPRVEQQTHYYNPEHQKLFDLGYKPTSDLEGEIKKILVELDKHKERIQDVEFVLIPEIRWDGSKEKSRFWRKY